LSAAGYSEYHPIASNDTSENRQKNRRVDVVILKASYAKAEPYY
jgi:chemotaxis protein MotB